MSKVFFRQLLESLKTELSPKLKPFKAVVVAIGSGGNSRMGRLRRVELEAFDVDRGFYPVIGNTPIYVVLHKDAAGRMHISQKRSDG